MVTFLKCLWGYIHGPNLLCLLAILEILFYCTDKDYNFRPSSRGLQFLYMCDFSVNTLVHKLQNVTLEVFL